MDSRKTRSCRSHTFPHSHVLSCSLPVSGGHSQALKLTPECTHGGRSRLPADPHELGSDVFQHLIPTIELLAILQNKSSKYQNEYHFPFLVT